MPNSVILRIMYMSFQETDADISNHFVHGLDVWFFRVFIPL